MSHNTLLIDTTDNQEIEVGLKIDNKKYLVKQKVDYRKAQAVLPLIEKILKKKKVELKDLKRIEVNTRLGSFTGVRVGLSVAQALGFALKIPIKRMIY